MTMMMVQQKLLMLLTLMLLVLLPGPYLMCKAAARRAAGGRGEVVGKAWAGGGAVAMPSRPDATERYRAARGVSCRLSIVGYLVA